jgi:FKBP-type peptidyl-prolyl cis-trans isomerase
VNSIGRHRLFLRTAPVLALALLAATACTTTNPFEPTPSIPYSQTDLVAGSGPSAAFGNRVTVSYTGWLYDSTKADKKGSQFESNANFPFTLGAGSVIRGWDVGVQGMRVGGQRRLVIPPELAYGSSGSGGVIPPYATLVFEITLISIQ